MSQLGEHHPEAQDADQEAEVGSHNKSRRAKPPGSGRVEHGGKEDDEEHEEMDDGQILITTLLKEE